VTAPCRRYAANRRDKRLAWLFCERGPAPAAQPENAAQDGRPAHTAELRTLYLLRNSLPNDYTVYHGVHWSLEWRSVPAFGEIDFIVVNRSGEVLAIEQKSGALEETPGGLVKQYADGPKNVAAQANSRRGRERF
jgi:hypothetical protein